jgi:nucleotidyltransferase substrate binding protein (TIGR01987 family)
LSPSTFCALAQFMAIDFGALEAALRSLEAALDPPPRNDRERDGAIQRFEYTFELSWKMIRRVLLSLGRADVSGSPKPLIREAHGEGMLSDVESWFTFLKARNDSSHLYDEGEADIVFNTVRAFPPYVHDLLVQLRRRAADP